MNCIEREPTTKSNGPAGTAITCLLVVTASVLCLFSLYLTILLYWPGPFRDLWEFMPDIAQQFRGEWSLDYLIQAYGGAHRIFLPKLLFFADWYWFKGLNLLTTAVAVACQAAYLLLVCRLLPSEPRLPRTDRWLLVAAFLAALFSTTQVSNFLYAMDVQWHMANLLALAACLSLILQPDRCTRFLLLGVAAALCNFTGLMCLVTGVLWYWLQPAAPPLAKRMLLSLAVVFVAAAYVRTPQAGQHILVTSLASAEDPATVAKVIAGSLWHMLRYISLYLSSPLSREWPLAGALLSWCLIFTCLYYWRKLPTGQLSRLQQACLLIATGIILNSLATAYGRMIYPNSATAERYQTLVLPFLPAILGLLLPGLPRSLPGSLARPALVMLLLVLLIPAQMAAAREMAVLSNRVHLAHTAARSGVLGLPYVGATLSHPLLQHKINAVADMDAFLRSERLGYFHLPAIGQIGDTSAARTLPDCGARLSSTEQRDASGIALHFVLGTNSPSFLQAQLTIDGRVTGFGQVIRPDGWLLPLSWIPVQERTLIAFTPSLPSTQPGAVVGLTGLYKGLAVCHQSIALP